jgi:hypothetical protein
MRAITSPAPDPIARATKYDRRKPSVLVSMELAPLFGGDDFGRATYHSGPSDPVLQTRHPGNLEGLPSEGIPVARTRRAVAAALRGLPDHSVTSQ